MKIGFDNDKYIKVQSQRILERCKIFNNKLYLELGGKLFDDFHASRVLPGFKPDAKIQVLKTLKDKLEIVFCINANHIENNKRNSNLDITYEMDVLRLIDELTNSGFKVGSVVITLYNGQPAADLFRNKLNQRNIKTYVHYFTKGYPTDVDVIVSDEGYGANDYIQTSRPIVVMAAPGPGSGKLATCLSQLYHDYKNGIKAGYAKYETFPVWDLPLKHPVNIAYEVATADLKDVNMIDAFHLDAYGIKTVNYNRDLEVFPVVKRILNKIIGEDLYKSPTDMGVNMISQGIVNDNNVKEASYQEMIRRYYKGLSGYKQGLVTDDTVERIKLLLNEAEVNINNRKVVEPAREKTKLTKVPSMAIELNNGIIITGKTTDIMTCSASCIINSLKVLANIDDDIKLLSPVVLEPMLELKKNIYGNGHNLLNIQDVLLGLSICSATNTLCEKALSKLSLLEGVEAHSTFFVSKIDESMMRQLKINMTNDAEYYTENLFYD